MKKAHDIWAHMIEAWEGALRSDSGSQAHYAAAKAIAQKRGFAYMTGEAVAIQPVEDIVKRALAVTANGPASQMNANALLGGVPEPGMTISTALDEFWNITIDHTRGKTEDQVRRWKNPRIKAIENLKSVIGNKEIAKITRADMKLFRDWWNTRIDKERLTANSANKDFTHIAHTLRVVNDALGLEINLPVSGLKIKESEKAKRLPFSDKWLREVVLKTGALDGLNAQARCIFLMCINTGARPSEIAGLMKHHIHIDGDVPFIEILPEGRVLKNAASKRRIPLVGCSLDAVKAYLRTAPKGKEAFPDYFGKDKLSATVNKYLAENTLLETKGHTLYGLRHSFEDRMTAAEPAWPERMKCDVFGHALARQRYGDGASLEYTHRWMLEIAL